MATLNGFIRSYGAAVRRAERDQQRKAREIFAYLPIEKSRISILAPLLNNSTGHLEEEVIISAIVISKTLKTLNLDQIDPSDSMVNFLHNMKFSKTTGFKAVTVIEFGSN